MGLELEGPRARGGRLAREIVTAEIERGLASTPEERTQWAQTAEDRVREVAADPLLAFVVVSIMTAMTAEGMTVIAQARREPIRDIWQRHAAQWAASEGAPPRSDDS